MEGIDVAVSSRQRSLQVHLHQGVAGCLGNFGATELILGKGPGLLM